MIFLGVFMISKCESCGMPMKEPEEFGGQNTKNKYCVHCTKPDGMLKSYDETLAGMSNFMAKTKNITPEKAVEMAKAYMKTMPAWKNR